MSDQIDAIFDGGVFRPIQPVHLPQGQPVTVVAKAEPLDGNWLLPEFEELADLLDLEFMAQMRQAKSPSISLEELRKITAAYPRSLSDLVAEDRNEG